MCVVKGIRWKIHSFWYKYQITRDFLLYPHLKYHKDRQTARRRAPKCIERHACACSPKHFKTIPTYVHLCVALCVLGKTNVLKSSYFKNAEQTFVKQMCRICSEETIFKHCARIYCSCVTSSFR